MTVRDAGSQVRRWKTVALVSSFVAVAAVSGVVGWAVRGGPQPSVPAAKSAFTGGGWVLTPGCAIDVEGIRLRTGDKIRVLDATGAELAAGKLMDGMETGHGCRQPFLVAGIPGNGGIYTLEVGRWRQTFTEVQLRGNVAEFTPGAG